MEGRQINLFGEILLMAGIIALGVAGFAIILKVERLWSKIEDIHNIVVDDRGPILEIPGDGKKEESRQEEGGEEDGAEAP